eukprot:COSAG01_NODE_55530_length_324_cov_1.111111_1_plen_32_part_10
MASLQCLALLCAGTAAATSGDDTLGRPGAGPS